MKQIFTLLLLAVSASLSAQFTENFESSLTSLTSNCWNVEQMNATTSTQEVITGNGSAYSNPPTSASGERTISTPFLDMLTSTVTISFKYKLSSKLAGQATRTIRVGLIDKNGVFTQLNLVTLNSSSPISVFTYNKTFALATPGVYRLALRFGGATGDGNSRLILDDLYVSASAHYGPTSHCNTAPVAVNDSYSIPFPSPVSGNLFANDVIPVDGDTNTAILVADSTKGILTVNSNGTFTFTPYANFLGGTVTFTYQVNDNGYTPLSSNIATVTLTFGYVTLLPMHLQSFTAKNIDKKTVLAWTISDNETGSYFEIQRSSDGKLFEKAGKVNANGKAGIQSYSFNENVPDQDTYYRILMVNANHTRSLSAVKFIRCTAVNTNLQVLGNPVQSKLIFSVQASANTIALVSVYNMGGVKILHSIIAVSSGVNNYSINVNILRQGNYILEYANRTNKTVSRFVKN